MHAVHGKTKDTEKLSTHEACWYGKSALSDRYTTEVGKGPTTGGSRGVGPDPPKFGRTSPTFFMKSVTTVT